MDYVAMVQEALNKKDYNQALSLSKQAITHTPHNGKAYSILAWAYFYLGEYRNAEINFDLAKQHGFEAMPDTMVKLCHNFIQKAEDCLSRGESQMALQWAQKAVDILPSHTLAVEILVRSLFELHQYEKLRISIENVVSYGCNISETTKKIYDMAEKLLSGTTENKQTSFDPNAPILGDNIQKVPSGTTDNTNNKGCMDECIKECSKSFCECCLESCCRICLESCCEMCR